MKKSLLLALLPFMLLGGCASEPGDELPPPPEDAKTVKLTKANCGLTSEESITPIEVSLAIEGTTDHYVFEFSADCYAHSTYEEFLIKKDASLKSKSIYKVEKLVIDYMSKKGTNFEVLNADNQTVKSHVSTTPTEYPGAEDYGAVLEYPIDGTSWTIRNTTEYKSAFYSVTVYFTL